MSVIYSIRPNEITQFDVILWTKSNPIFNISVEFYGKKLSLVLLN